MGKIIYSLILVFCGLAAGYIFQILVNKKRIQLSVPVDHLRKQMQKAALLFFNPVAILGATWIADLDNIKIAILPFIGLTALFSGGLIAFTASRFFNLSRKQTGSYIVCGGFTNIGSLGALFCFIFLGEPGFALVPFYKLFEEFSYYAFGFPLAKSYSSLLSESESFIQRIRKVVTDIFVLMAVGSILTGLALNFSGLERPEFYGTVNAVFIPAAALLLLISIGMAMRFSSVHVYLKQSLFIACIKFVMVPFIIVTAGYFAGLGQMDNGLPLKVVLILSCMPVGFIAMVPPTIYDLDIDLANACWLTTNGLLLLVIPVLLFILKIL